MIKFVKNYFLIILSLVICCSSISVFQTVPTHAAGQYKTISDMEPAEQIASYSYYLGLKECINNAQYKTTLASASLDEIFAGSSHEVYVGYIAESVAAKQGIKVSEGDGIMWCSNIAQAAFSLWGLNSVDVNSVLNDFGYSKQKTYQCIVYSTEGGVYGLHGFEGSFPLPSPASNIKNGYGNSLNYEDVTLSNINDFCDRFEESGYQVQTPTDKFPNDTSILNYQEVLSENQVYTTELPTIIDAIRTNIYGLCKSGSMSCSTGNDEPQLDNGLLYLLNKYYFENENICNAKSYGLSSELKQKVTTSEYTNITSGSYGPYAEVKLITNTTTGATDLFSYAMTSEKAKNNSELPLWPVNVITTCASVKDSLSEKAKLIFDDILNTGNYTKYEKVLSAAGPADNTAATVAGKTDDNKSTTTCAINGVGWIICPIVNFMAKVIDDSWGILTGFLEVNSSIVGTKDANGEVSSTYQAWQMVRNIANVAFAIVFLIIIFSQVTSFGISNYGIKKMLPKLIIAAILVNLSFYICQIAVDISNILGYSIKSIFDGLAKNVSAVSILSDLPESATGFTGFGGLAVGALTVVGGGALLYAGIGTLIPVLLGGIVAVLMILFMLIGRQALVILLVVISPLAFVAYLLPNTEKLFDKWKKLLLSLLLLFPIVALVVGASSLASGILNTVFTSTNNQIGQIAAAAVAILPLFVVPGMLKKSLDGVGNIGATLNKLGAQAGGNLGKFGSKKYDQSTLSQYKKYRSGVKDKKRAFVQSGAYKGLNPVNKLRSNINKNINNSRLSGAFGDKMSRMGIELEASQDAEAIKSAAIKRKFSGISTVQDNTAAGQLRKVAYGQKITTSTGQVIDGSNFHSRADAIQEIVASNDITAMNQLWDDSMSWTGEKGTKLRNILADSMMSSSSRPAWFGAGKIAALRTGTHSTASSTIRGAIMDGTYAPSKIAAADKNELQILAHVNSTDMSIPLLIRNSLVTNARNALTDPILGKQMGKNNASAADISSRTDPGMPL